ASAGEHADAPPVAVPAGHVSVADLAPSLGAEVAHAVEALEPGQLTETLKAGDDLWIARLVAREGGQVAPLDEVRASVFAAWQREDDARRLRRWLDQRRKETRVVVREGPL
ncbi:MAG TPA: peptidylprolyl isomerase, partial [Polyangiaceae bacterium]